MPGMSKEMAAYEAQIEKEDAAQMREKRWWKRNARIDRQHLHIVTSKRWQKLVASYHGLPAENLSAGPLPNGAAHMHSNVLVVGTGKHADLTPGAIQFLVGSLVNHCSFFAGTPAGNPGAVLHVALNCGNVPQTEVRLYQPSFAHFESGGVFGSTFDGVPVEFVEGLKDCMRRKMIADSHAVLVLGGAEGTLREVLLALDAGKPTIVIEGYGPVAAYVLSSKRLRAKPNLKQCPNLVAAVQTILDLSRV